MPIRVRCSQCQTLYNVADEKIGKLIRCSKCQATFRAEAPTTAVQPAANTEAKTKTALSGAMAVKPQPQPPANEEGAPLRADPNRSKRGLILASCGALLFLLLSCGGVGGYFAYTGNLNSIKNRLTGGSDKKVDEGPTYTLIMKSRPSLGKAVRVTVSGTTKGNIKVTQGGAVEERPINGTTEKIYTCVVLEGRRLQPAKFQEIYEKATESEPVPHPSNYQGCTITYDFQGPDYRVTLSPAPSLGVDERKFACHARNAFSHVWLLPRRPVRVGDTWIPDESAFDLFKGDSEINVADSNIMVKLERVYEKNGQQMAVISVEANLSITRIEYSTDVGRQEFKGTLEFVLDGSSTATSSSFTSKTETHGSFQTGNKNGTFVSIIESTSKEERSAETDAPK